MPNYSEELCTIVLLLSDCVKSGLNRSFIAINSLIPWAFALSESKILVRAKVSISISFVA